MDNAITKLCEADLDRVEAERIPVQPWMHRQGRGPEPVLMWDDDVEMSFAWNPMSWRQEIWQVVSFIVILACFGTAFYGVGLHYGWF